MLALKRTRNRAGLFLGVFGVVLLLSGLSVWLSGFLASAATSGTRAGVTALAGGDGGFRITIPLADDQSAQDALVQAAIHRVLRTDGHPMPILVARDVETIDTVALTDESGGSVRATLASVSGLAGSSLLVAGAWPTSAAEASMQADAAHRLGVNVGERLTIPGGAPITITATWRVRDPGDPRWLANSIPLTGAAVNGAPGWVVIDPSLWRALAGGDQEAHLDARAQWTVRPDASRVTAAQLPVLLSGSDDVANLLAKRQTANVQQSGDLRSGVLPIVRNVASTSAAATGPLVIVGVLGLVMLVELARMLEQLRRDENAVLRVRGASRARFVLGTAAEAAFAAAPGAVVGAAVAAGLLALRGAAGGIPLLGWLGAGVAALVAVTALAAAAGQSSGEITRGSPMRGSGGPVGLEALGTKLGAGLGNGRARSIVEVGAVAVLVVAAVISVSQFLKYGSPLVPTADGGVGIDPLIVSAPALAIAAIAVVGTAAFPLVARLLERTSRRRRDLRSLPLRHLARRSRTALTPILLVSFAMSGLVVGASYSGTWAVAVSQTRAAQIGAPLRVIGPGALDHALVRPFVGQVAAAAGNTTLIQLGDGVSTLVELPASRLTRLLSPVPGVVDPAFFQSRLADRAVRPVLPTAASGISVVFTASTALAIPSGVDVTVVDAAGTESRLSGTLVPTVPASSGGVVSAESGTGAFEVALPKGIAPWTVHALDVAVPDLTAGSQLSFALRSTGGSAAAVPLDESWAPSRSDDGIVALDSPPGETGLRVERAAPGGHVLFQSVPGSDLRIPVVVSPGVARDAGLSVGTRAQMTLLIGGGRIPVRVAGISPVVPGITSGDGVMVDLASIQDAAIRQDIDDGPFAEPQPLISATEWWVSTTRPEEAAAQVSARSTGGAVALTQATPAADEVLGSARTAIWIAGGAIALLAILALLAGLLAELRTRREEAGILRALGVTPVEQARDRVIEWATLLGLGVLIGLIDGVAVCAALVPGLARMAVPDAIDALPTTFRLDLVGGLVELLFAATAMAAVLVVVFVTVRGQASDRVSDRVSAQRAGPR